MPGPLHGLRVVDCSSGLAGPRLTGLLADYGADVIWIERPGGDPFRGELRVAYSVTNRGKRSAVLDLPVERDTLFELLSDADVFVESWQPGVADRLGLGWADLHDRFPGLVACSISGFGADGPWRDVPGYEAIVHALAGTMGHQTGYRDGPIYEGVPFASLGAAYLGTIGVLSALYRRGIDGIGRHIETSLLDGLLGYMGVMWADTDIGQARHDIGALRLVCRAFQTADEDETYLGLHTGAHGAWGRFIRLVGLDDRVAYNEDGMDHGLPLTPEERAIVDQELPPLFLHRTRDEWIKLLLEADIAVTPILRPGEAFDDEQVRENGMVLRVDDPDLGPVDQVAPAMRFSRAERFTISGAPATGSSSNQDLAWRAERWSRPEPPVGSTAEANRPPALLDGIRILDLGSYHAGPYASRLLADLGADVVKIEPLRGDVERGMATTFRNAQSGKRSICLDLKAEGAVEARDRVIAWADIIHHNMRPGAGERLDIDYDSVRRTNPEIIYLHAPGWGTTGPYRRRQSFEPLQSYFVGAGFEAAGEYNPPVIPAGIADPGAGLLSAAGMLMALVHRQRTGHGQLIENPQLNATLAHVAHIVRTPEGEVLGGGRLDVAQLGVGPLDRLYQTADGWLCLTAIQPAEITALGQVLGPAVQGLLADPATEPYALAAAIDTALSARPAAEWVELFTSVGVPAAEPSMDHRPLFREPTSHRIGRVAEITDEKHGRIREAAVLLRATETTMPPHRQPPGLGDHTREFLAAVGYNESELDDLTARQSIR